MTMCSQKGGIKLSAGKGWAVSIIFFQSKTFALFQPLNNPYTTLSSSRNLDVKIREV